MLTLREIVTDGEDFRYSHVLTLKMAITMQNLQSLVCLLAHPLSYLNVTSLLLHILCL